MENEISAEFLACLKDYRKKSTIHRSFQAWRKYVMLNRRRYNKACMALEQWNYYTTKKCFNILKGNQAIKCRDIPYSKGIYFIILAALCFLPQKTIKSYGCRIDKVLSLFKQNNILNPNLQTLKRFVKSWEVYLNRKYFGLLQKRWLLIKDFKLWRKRKIRSKCFYFLKKLLKNKRGAIKLKNIIKSHYFRQLFKNTQFQQVLGIKNEMAMKYWKKQYLQKCFQILVDFTTWNRQNTDKIVLSRKFYELNLMMKSFTGMKLFIKSGALQKNRKVMYKKFRNNNLLEKTFKTWKNYQLKKNYLKIKLEGYLHRKNLDSKKIYMDNWRWMFVSKVKLTYYTKLKLLEKGWRGLKEMTEKKQKVRSISRMSMSHSGKKNKLKKKQEDELNDFLLEEKQEVLDKILLFQQKRQNNALRNSFRKLERARHSHSEMKKLKYQASLYKDISCYKNYFGIWRQRFTQKAGKYKSRVLARDYDETRTLKKTFRILKQHYLENLSERVKLFRGTQFHEEGLLKKVFLVLDTERKVSNLLCTKFYERYCQKIARNCFEALLDFSQKERQIKRIIRGFREEKDKILIKIGFYFLKKRADFNLIKRRSNKLAQIMNKKRLYGKAFQAFKHMHKLCKKEMLVVKRKEKRVLRNLYFVWKLRFREEKKVKKVTNYCGSNKMSRIFEEWKKYSERKRIAKSIIEKCTEKRNAIYLGFTWAIWRKLISLSRQKKSVGQALFISYVYKFKKQVLLGWKEMAKKLQRQRQIQSRLSNQINEKVMTKYFEIWFKRNENFRDHMRKGIEYKKEKQNEILNKVFKFWVRISKEKAIKKKLLDLWEEKIKCKLLARSFRAWNIYVVGRNTREKIINVKSQFSELQMQKRVFCALRYCVEKRKREKEISEQIRNLHMYRLMEQCFSTWCEEFQDLAFERAGSELVDKLFQRKIEEHKEVRNYGNKLDQFALEVYKRKSFLTFSKNASRLVIQRNALKESEELFLALRRKRAFREFKQLIMPRIDRMRTNFKAMKFYVLKLYLMAFDHWKLFLSQQGRLKTVSDERKEKISIDWKTKFIDNFSEQNKNESREKSTELEDKKNRQLKRNVLHAWKNQIRLNNKLQIANEVWFEVKNKFKMEKYFHAWFGKYEENNQRRHSLANALEKVYKSSIEKGFSRLAKFYLKKKKLEICFDEIHEKYITKLLKKNFDSWQTQFVFQRLASHDSADEDTQGIYE